jgi:hypothetical protein
MKNTPASIMTAITSDVCDPFLLLDMEFASGTIRLTNLPYNVVVGPDTYISDGGLVEFSPPQLTSNVNRETYRIKITDYQNTYKDEFEANAVGTPVTVRLGVNDDTANLDIVYKGRIDATRIETNPSEGSKDAIIDCSSPFGALDRTTDRRTDKDTQRQIDATDTCFDRILFEVSNIELRWGKV